MASLGLDHPSDITWERECASEDMIDAAVCDTNTPAKWHSSLALFSYTPDDEYQVYKGREIVYLKVAATLTGYQPKREEIEGELERGEFNTEVEREFEEMLDTYRKCTGGLLQVTVGPPEENRDEWDTDEYPYLMDYQPKRRALYSMVTDTDKRMSRSTEQTQLRKAAGSTESNEILDVDLGGSHSVSGGVSGGTEGFKVGVQGSYSQSNRQRVGSKQMDRQTENRVQTSSRSQEQREGYSHTTQLTQLHHLLDSYHKGTNRALFFFLPRPYVKEEPTGFVRGPRGIDGVQEILLVVNKPKEMDDLQVSTRLDTGHYGTVTKYDYDYTSPVVSGHTIDLNPPGPDNPEAVNYGEDRVTTVTDIGNVKTGEQIYECYRHSEQRTKQWRPENNNFSGYTIDTTKGNGGYEIINSNRSVESGVDVSVDSSGDFLTIETEATSRACHYDRATGAAGAARRNETINEQDGYASVDVKVYLRSTEKTEKVGTEKELLVTTRGLCCGPGDNEGSQFPNHIPVDTVDVTDDLTRVREKYNLGDLSLDGDGDEEGDESDEPGATGMPSIASDSSSGRTARTSAPAGMMTIHEANELGTTITREALGKSASRRGGWTPRSTVEADHTVRTLANVVRESPTGRRRLQESAASVDAELTRVLADELDESFEDVTRRSVVDADIAELQRITGLDRGAINRGKLALLGLPVRDTGGDEGATDGSDGSNGDGDGDDPDLDVDIEADLDDDEEYEVDIDVEANVSSGSDDDPSGDASNEAADRGDADDSGESGAKPAVDDEPESDDDAV